LYAKAQGDPNKPYPTLALALSALPEADWSVLSPHNPLHHWHLIHTEPGRTLTQSPITIDRRILCYLLGEPALVPQLSDLVTPARALTTDLPATYQTLAQQLVATWSQPHHQWPLLTLTGPDATTRTQIAVAACDLMGLGLMTLSTAVLPTDPQELRQLQRHWEREAILTNCALLLDCDTTTPGDPARETAISLFLETLSTPVIISSRERKPQVRRPLITFDIPPLTHTEQTALWHTHLGPPALELDGHIHRLATQFRLSPTAVESVCIQALGSTSEAPTDLPHTLWTLCRSQARPNLDDLAQRIEPAATWDDLVLPDRQRQILGDISTHLTHSARVYHQWGFAQKGNRGLGISALFYGESGTGKTMAAEVLAATCNLDLYRIDLSTVVSKYNGETEKNLCRIFDAAETGGAILLFDEADALFGKRSEVKDSHDRHANIEVSYLLQRMETYRGLAILTSNLKDSLDVAFLRRLRFMVPFPMPDAYARAEIWRRIFPSQTPTQGLDATKLGQLKVAGGHIRNIALNAAFLAAQCNTPITMEHIRQAAQREYLKLEKLLTNEEIKGWS
ncbi:MAG: ATP-binding protein, partial [Leptolyngbyaceae cyanobacterium]